MTKKESWEMTKKFFPKEYEYYLDEIKHQEMILSLAENSLKDVREEISGSGKHNVCLKEEKLSLWQQFCGRVPRLYIVCSCGYMIQYINWDNFGAWWWLFGRTWGKKDPSIDNLKEYNGKHGNISNLARWRKQPIVCGKLNRLLSRERSAFDTVKTVNRKIKRMYSTDSPRAVVAINKPNDR